MADTTAWTPRGAWVGILPVGAIGAGGPPGLTVEPREGLGIAHLIVPSGGEAALAAAVEQLCGRVPPAQPRMVRGAMHVVVWSGPGQWLLLADRRDGFAATLDLLGQRAAVADQSHARAALRLAGPRVRDMLAKGCMLDLHPAAFPPGTAALTSIAHVAVHLWRVDDGADPLNAVFDMMIPRSMAGSFWSWLSAAAAEFGCMVFATGRG